MAFVEFKDVCKTYHMGSVEVRAVDRMNFTIERGELVVIVGPSGAGKTTVLNMLGGMDSATSGTIIPLPADEVLRQVGLGHRMDNFPAQLSGGEQQRVAIARALAKNPKLLLCDEPTGALDYKTGKQILKLLQDTCREMGRTVAIVTHNSAFTQIADRVIEVREGKASRIVLNEAPQDAMLVEW